MKNYVGIDLGTTNSVVCSYDGDETRIWKSPEQNDVTPSIIYMHRRGIHILGLLATERDLLFLLCVRQRRFDLGESPYYLSVLEDEYRYCVPGEAEVLSAADKDLLQYPWTEDDIANTSYIVTLVNEMAARSIPLDSSDHEVRDNANELMGMAVNFIVGTPYIFGQEASHP